MFDFSRVFCSGSPFGPWDEGLTPCFVDVVVTPVVALLSIAVLVIAIAHGRHMSSHNTMVPLSWLRFVLCLLLLLLNIGLFIVRILTQTLLTNELIRYASWSISWTLFALVLSLEASHRVHSSRWTQLWVCLSFMVLALRFDVAGHFEQQYLAPVMIVEMCFGGVLSVLVWLVNGEDGKDDDEKQKKEKSSEMQSLLESKDRSQMHHVVFKECPEDKANFFSRTLLMWASSLYKLGYEHPLQPEDLWPLATDDKASTNAALFASNRLESGSLLRVLFRCYGAEYALIGALKVMNDIAIFVGPLLLNLVLKFLATPEWPWWYGVLFSLGILISSSAQTLAINNYFFHSFRIGQRVRASLITALYQKSLTISQVARQKYSTGEVTNLMNVDATRIQQLFPYMHYFWSAPIQIAVSLYLLYAQLGVSIFAGLGSMLLVIPINVLVLKCLNSAQVVVMEKKDFRMRILTEIVSGIRIVKFFAWEESFWNRIQKARDSEMKLVAKSNYLNSISGFFWSITPVIVAFCTFLTYTLLSNDLTPDVAFTSVALFNVLRFPLMLLPDILTYAVDAKVSLNRIDEFLAAENRDSEVVEWSSARAHYNEAALAMYHASFGWAKKDEPVVKPVLSDLNFEVLQGRTTCIVGPVGAGKSSILAAFLGDMQRLDGRALVRGSVAYAQQHAWIENTSLKSNITFGHAWNPGYYQQVLDACQLRADLDLLPAGDETEIGEKGINLSGGQKQRVSLARAVYSNKDVYLLDDVLSAVDVHVGRAIFDGVIMGMLRGKTVLLVTHQLQYLSRFDHIIYVQDGSIKEQGTYDELMQKQDGALSRLVIEFSSRSLSSRKDKGKSEDGGEEEGAEEEETVEEKEKPKGIMSTEERELGSLDGETFRQYAVACGLFFVALTCIFLVGEAGMSIAQSYWLSLWSNDTLNAVHTSSYWLGMYSLLGAVAAFASLVAGLFLAKSAVNASLKMHAVMLKRVLRGTTTFFDTTPLGRILNRFSGDISTMDDLLPGSFSSFLQVALMCLGVLVIIVIVTPLFLCFVFPLGYVYRYAQSYYIASSRELKRLDSISRSPIYSHFGETINGATTIRAFQKEKLFIDTNMRKLDRNQEALFCLQTSNRWLGLRLETVGNVVVSLSALLAVSARGTMSAGFAGLSVSYALQLTGMLGWFVRTRTSLEMQMVSVERVLQYQNVPIDPEPDVPSAPDQWPLTGSIEFQKVCLRYREGLDLVLRQVSFSVKSGEKIGIVGRTGAGKSSLMLALFRFMELDSGTIVIDGVDICKIGTHFLRRAITIIPQDPVLFMGNVRHNLDPFDECSDEQVFEALEKAHLKNVIVERGGLTSEVAEGGENFSVGQRQLFCLARALLRPAKILVLDEATSNVDAENDSLIQKTIRSAFADRTVLTIAHRINTIMDSDRILVMSKGEVAEFDSPNALLSNSNSIFAQMVSGH